MELTTVDLLLLLYQRLMASATDYLLIIIVDSNVMPASICAVSWCSTRLTFLPASSVMKKVDQLYMRLKRVETRPLLES